MSILVSHSWLEDYLGTGLDSTTLPEMLTNVGIEVEDVLYGNSLSDNFVIGVVESVRPHSNSKKLSCCKVNIGTEILDIVCGCPTVRSDIFVVVATIGARMPGGLVIEARELLGEKSDGMICSASELGLTNDSKGIMILNVECSKGDKANTIIESNDIIYNISLTPDRGDCFSIKGLAREASAVQLGQAIKRRTSEKTFELADYSETKLAESYLIFQIDTPNKASDFFMQQRLLKSGYQSQSFWVDYTQYYMHESGQPMHAFDADKVSGTPFVRYARKGEKLRIIGDKVVELLPEILVIADNNGAIAIAGVIGGHETSVSSNTKKVLIEIACFNKEQISKSCQLLKINTSASDRFSRGVDPVLVLELANQVISDFGSNVVRVSGYVSPVLNKIIKVSFKDVLRVLGKDARPEQMLLAMNSRGFEVKVYSDYADVSVPTHRLDINDSIEVIEEMLRISGHQFWPVSEIEMIGIKPVKAVQNPFVDYLVANSFNQMLTYSFIDPKWLECVNYDLAKEYLLKNPMSIEASVMRPSAIFGLLDRVAYNKNRQIIARRVFELGCVFHSGLEHNHLSGLVLGHPVSTWLPEQSDDFFVVKGIIDRYLSNFARTDYKQSSGPCWYHPHACAEIHIAGEMVGFVGVIHPRLCAYFDLDNVIAFELDLDKIDNLSKSSLILKEVPKYPSSRKDLSFYVDSEVRFSDIISTINSLCIEEILNIELFDIYISDRISYSFALTFQSESSTLNDADIMSKVVKIVSVLESELKLELRGDLCQGNLQKQKQI